MKTIKLLALFFVSSLVFVSCSSDDDHDDHDHEKELITTVTYTLTNGDDVVTLKFEDLDGEGGTDGTYTVSGNLSANTTYTGSIELLNATENPAEDITEEVEEEGDEHEFFYTSTISDITFTKTDTDEDGNPIGIETTLTTGDAGTGSLTIILKHEPTKPNDGTSTSAGGSTDVSVTFSIEVE
ncbi:type 1 periplasmic binding fold superfamily protein [Seonamhaeicola sp. S2-3]|uniref:type 1 periplasmic binding fold superfamily protein n=1 Tax=Seonamhaeicola sp. S2-3 TaxID=1936081 RepID=UPI000972DB40|nr:type 1 periplasmic binding fold superfamily protein [Seonamhaeicola sp. S2-3]APY12725.1 type 1 periplasmic binding fold superfamily protein [Seonamhaeicola sp. S2-3]